MGNRRGYIRLFRVVEDEERTRIDIPRDSIMGWGVQFPDKSCYVYWNLHAYPPEDRLEHPHVSVYGSIADVEQGTGGATQHMDDYPIAMDADGKAFEWKDATKKPIEIQYRGPYDDPRVVETIEGDYEIDQEYINEHGGFVIIQGVDGEEYPCALDIFRETYNYTDSEQ